MKKRDYQPSPIKKVLPFVVFISVFILVLSFVVTGLQEASSASDSEGLRIAEESIKRAVINCYASEGIYPPSFDYLKVHYGLSIDEHKYIVHYEIFAENIMPEITEIKY